MSNRILCFTLNGYMLGVDKDQIEKVLINKHAAMSAFTLETGVEVKRLDTCIPLPADEQIISENILFVRDQKDFLGFTVDRVNGYLSLRGRPTVGKGGRGAPISYFVKNEGQLIPVLDLTYITNTENSVDNQTLEDIMSLSPTSRAAPVEGGASEDLPEISEEEIYRSIDEEIQKAKSSTIVESVIQSEKKGALLPLLLNVGMVVIFGFGLLFFTVLSRSGEEKQQVGETVTGVEEQVIQEIRRRSQQEVEEQRRKLEEARERLKSLEQEKENFLTNQDQILAERQQKIDAEFQQRLEEARRRINASGAANADELFAAERAKLESEYQSQKAAANEEIERIKREYEQALAKQQQEISQEVGQYTERIGEIETQLREEQGRLREAEERFQSAQVSQEEYVSFRRQLNGIYNNALTLLSQENYSGAIQELNTIPPIIERARQAGIGQEQELNVEDRLVENLLQLARREASGADLEKVAQTTFQSATELEGLGNLTEALSRYFTVYTISADEGFKDRAFGRAEALLDTIIGNRSQEDLERLNQEAGLLFAQAMALKNERQYEQSLDILKNIVTDYPGTTVIAETFDEIGTLTALISARDEEQQREILNQGASDLMRLAQDAYENEFYADALDKYEQVVKNFKGSDFTDHAISEIVRINDVMRNMRSPGTLIVQSSSSKVGVVIQLSSKNTFLFNLGTRDGLKAGDVYGIYRREEERMSFIGNVRVEEVFPTISQGRVMFAEKDVKIGDIVSAS
jgi:hypothetical protein